jgi:hypothetical protein
MVVVEWMDACGNDLAVGTKLLPAKVRTVGWVWQRTSRPLTIHSEILLSGHVEGDARDATTILAAMLRKVRVIPGEERE